MGGGGGGGWGRGGGKRGTPEGRREAAPPTSLSLQRREAAAVAGCAVTGAAVGLQTVAGLRGGICAMLDVRGWCVRVCARARVRERGP